MGFFEHQYLRYKKNHIKNLLALAKVDGHMHEKEVALLFKIAKPAKTCGWGGSGCAVDRFMC